jgi:CorA-like Mg2+ transporter protein
MSTVVACAAYQDGRRVVDLDVAFMVLRTARLVEAGIEFGETHVFAGKGYVISVCHGATSSYKEVRARCESAPELLKNGEDYVLYAIMDFVVDNYMPIVDAIERQVEEIEDAVQTSVGPLGRKTSGVPPLCLQVAQDPVECVLVGVVVLPLPQSLPGCAVSQLPSFPSDLDQRATWVRPSGSLREKFGRRNRDRSTRRLPRRVIIRFGGRRPQPQLRYRLLRIASLGRIFRKRFSTDGSRSAHSWRS